MSEDRPPQPVRPDVPDHRRRDHGALPAVRRRLPADARREARRHRGAGARRGGRVGAHPETAPQTLGGLFLRRRPLPVARVLLIRAPPVYHPDPVPPPPPHPANPSRPPPTAPPPPPPPTSPPPP